MADQSTAVPGRRRQWERVLTLQAALLHLDFCVAEVREVDAGEASEAATKGAHQLSAALREVMSAFQDVKEHSTTGLRGVPSWLGPQEGATDDGTDQLGGLRLLQQRLDSPTPVWDGIRARLSAEPAGFMLKRLEQGWRELAQQGTSLTDAADETTGLDPAPGDGITVVFPMVHNRGNGFLVEMVLRPRDTAEPGMATNHRPTDKFTAGLSGACRAAFQLAEGLGVSREATDRWEQYDLSFHGIPHSIRLDDTSASMPTAVALTGRLLGLAAARQLVTGEIRADGTVGGLPTAADLIAKRRAVCEHDRELLNVEPEWTLSEVCTRLWRDSWDNAVEHTARRGMRDLEHEVRVVDDVRTGAVAGEWDFTPVRLSAVDDILLRMKAGAPAIVVGGPRSSARTTAARQAALEWEAAHRTPVIEVRLKDGILPVPSELRHVVTLARYATGVQPGAPAVVILEDLIPHEDAADLDALLPSDVEQTCSTLIAVCLYFGGKGWKTDELATAPSLYRPEDLRGFSEEFSRLNGLGLDDWQLSIAQQASDGDIGYLVGLLLSGQLPSPAPGDRREELARAATAVAPAEEAEADGPPQPNAESDPVVAFRRAFVRRVRKEATPEWLKEMKAVAAASLLGIGVPKALLGAMPEPLLMNAGARLDSMERWYIDRSAACRALLASDEGITDPTGREWKRTADAQYEALATLLRPCLRAYDPVLTGFITALLTSAKATEPGLYLRLLTLVTPALSRIEVDAPPVVVAHAVLACGSDGSDEGRQRLFETLIRSIFAAGWQTMTARQAGICLRAIRSYRDFADWQILPVYQEVLGQVRREMGRVLARADPAQGLLFVQELGRLWEETTRGEILALAVQATTRCDAGQLEHYQAVVGLVDAALKYGDDRGAVVPQFVRAPGVRRLLAAGTSHDAGLILARAAIHLMLDRPAEETTEQHRNRRRGGEVSAALPTSTPTGVIAGLALLERINLWAARTIVQASTMDNWLRAALQSEEPDGLTPWQVAQLVRRLGRIDARTVLKVLYTDGNPVADRKVVGALADCVIRMGDFKGVGYVVSAVNSVDAFWGPGGPDSAAAQLCARLENFVNEALEDEMRGSVVLAVITALVDANIPPNSLKALLGRCADVVVTEIRDNQKEHGPRLALLLGRHTTVGPDFLDMLSTRIEDKQLLDRMMRCPSVEARASYMDLTRALRRPTDENFVESFLDLEWLEDSTPVLRGGSVLNSLRALRAYTRLLRDVGMVFVGEDVLRAVDQDPKWWAERLKRLYHPAHWSQALHELHQLAPGFAAECLSQLDALYRPEAKYGGALRSAPSTAGQQEARIPEGPSPVRIAMLQQRRSRANRQFRGLLRLVERRFLQLEEAVELIYAVRTIDEEAGRGIGATLSAGENWERRVRSLLDADSPEQLGIQLRMMAQTKLHLPEQLRKRLFSRWKAQAYGFRSPAVAQSLVCGFAASGTGGPELAEQLADKLNLERIAVRLGRGLPRDLAMAPALIRTLHVWGPSGSAEKMAAALPPRAGALVDVSDAVNLLLVLLESCPDKIADYVEGAVDAVTAQSRLHYLPDPETHWREVGWLIRATRAAGGSVPDPDAVVARAEASCHRPEITAWVEGCLGRFPPTDSWVPDDSAAPDWCEAARLLVHSELAPSGTPLPGRLGGLLPRVSLRWQIHLLRRAAQDPELRHTLTEEDLSQLAFLGRHYLEVGRPSGSILLRAVTDLTGT